MICNHPDKLLIVRNTARDRMVPEFYLLSSTVLIRIMSYLIWSLVPYFLPTTLDTDHAGGAQK